MGTARDVIQYWYDQTGEDDICHMKQQAFDNLVKTVDQFSDAQIKEAMVKAFEGEDCVAAHIEHEAYSKGFSECLEKAIKAFPCIISLHDPCGNCVNCMAQVRLSALTPDGKETK